MPPFDSANYFVATNNYIGGMGRGKGKGFGEVLCESYLHTTVEAT